MQREQGLVQRGGKVYALFMLALVSVWGGQAWAYSAWQDAYVNRLRNISVNYQVDGAICEQVARLELEAEYPRQQYKVDVNLAYGLGNQVLGELDVVVSEKFSDAVILVGEVKCWTEPGRAQAKGAAQRLRFMDHIQRTQGLWVRQDHRYFKMSRFGDLRDFVLIGPRGSRRHGFERELRLGLEDLMDLRRTMMDCQKAGECAAP